MIDLHGVVLSAFGFAPHNIAAQIDGAESFLRSFDAVCKSAKRRHVAARVFLILSLLASRRLAAIAVVAIVARQMDKCCCVVCKSSGHAIALGARARASISLACLSSIPTSDSKRAASCSSPLVHVRGGHPIASAGFQLLGMRNRQLPWT